MEILLELMLSSVSTMNHLIDFGVCALTDCTHFNILRKTIEGYLDSVPSLSLNTIKTLLIMYAFHSSRLLQSKLMIYFSHASMV